MKNLTAIGLLLASIFAVSPGLAKVGDGHHLPPHMAKKKNRLAKNITPGPKAKKAAGNIPPGPTRQEKKVPQKKNKPAKNITQGPKNKVKKAAGKTTPGSIPQEKRFHETKARMQGKAAPSTRSNEELVYVSVFTDDYPEEVGWEIRDDTNDEVMWVSTGTYDIPNHWYDSWVYLERGRTYTFEIWDEECDGLCCDYGYGWYDVMSDSGGDFLAFGDMYECSESTEFVVPDDGSSGTVPVTIGVFTDDFPQEVEWYLDDGDWTVVASVLEGDYTSAGNYYTTTVDLDSSKNPYTFTIYDAAHDGLCCDFGYGYFEVSSFDDYFLYGDVYASFHSASFNV